MTIRALVLVLGALILSATAAACECRRDRFEGVGYAVCSFRADRDDLRLFHRDATGRVYGQFGAIDRALSVQGARLSFAMNGGMYHDDRRPVGLYVEGGREVSPIVTRAGPGNFGLLPNGVFCLTDQGASVTESRQFAKVRPPCRYASQSGPMLVIGGNLHPRFLVNGSSKYIRNGVGVAADGVTVHFAISEARVNFYDFGRYFRDVLATPNALYLDGKVSRLYAPSLGRSDAGFALGPIVGAVEER